MNISPDTDNVVEFLDTYTNKNLRKKNDLAMILEIAATYDAISEINEIIFNGKALWGIFQALRKTNSDDSNLANMKNQFSALTKEISSQLKTLLELEYEALKERFDKVYFQNTDGALLNLMDLCHDLSELKNLQNDLKSGLIDKDTFFKES